MATTASSSNLFCFCYSVGKSMADQSSEIARLLAINSILSNALEEVLSALEDDAPIYSSRKRKEVERQIEGIEQNV